MSETSELSGNPGELPATAEIRVLVFPCGCEFRVHYFEPLAENLGEDLEHPRCAAWQEQRASEPPEGCTRAALAAWRPANDAWCRTHFVSAVETTRTVPARRTDDV